MSIYDHFEPDTITVRVLLDSDRPNPRVMAARLAASRGPALTGQDVLELRAVVAVCRDHARVLEGQRPACDDPLPSDGTLEIVAEAGWEEIPTLHGKFLILADLDAMWHRVRRVWPHAVYLLHANGYPWRHLSRSLDKPSPELLAELPELLARADRPLTARQARWFASA